MSLHREPRRVHGFTDIGPITIPPRPQKPALVDRVDGNTYELIKSGSVPALSLLTNTSGFQVFAAFDGPYIRDGNERTRRLFSSSGTLDSEPVAFNAAQASVSITVAVSPLDVFEVVWDAATQSLTLTETL